MAEWFDTNIVEPGKLPLLLCLLAFVLTFLSTRIITRMIRAGVGPFRNNVSTSGVHIHHAVPGLILLITGALTSVAANHVVWQCIAAVLIGTGSSLILDEFALILHLQDVYWANEGRVSVELIGLTAACLGMTLLGFSPWGVDSLEVGDVTLRITFVTGVVIQLVFTLVCVLKAKYRTALISCFVPFIAWVAAARLGRPGSWWARRFYGRRRMARAERRAEKFDHRWDPRWRWLSDFIAGAPSIADPPAVLPVPTSTDPAPATSGRASG